MSVRSRVSRAMLAATIAAVARLALTATPSVYVLDIPAENLGTALLEFAKITHEQIAFDGKLVEPYRSTAISGTYTVAQALHALVGTAPLLIRTTSSGVLTVVAETPGRAGGGAGIAAAGARSPPPTKVLQAITVTAQRAKLQNKVRTFVDEIAATEQGAGAGHWGGEGFARWRGPVCPSVTGLPLQAQEIILEHVLDIGRAAGVPLAGRHCRPNLFVLFTAHSQQLLRTLASQTRAVVFGRAAPRVVDDFIATPGPVKVWYNSAPVTPDDSAVAGGLPGFAAITNGTGTGPGAFSEPPGGGAPIISDWERASHITSTLVWTFSSVYVIVDQTRVQAATQEQLADYLGMVGLAQLKPTARLGDAPSILRLFDGSPRAAPAGATGWDRAFLRSLYGTEQSSRMQRDLIVRRMLREIVP